MPPKNRPTRLGAGNGYQRPSLSVLDDLTDPGTRGNSGTSGTSGTRGASISLVTPDAQETAGTSVSSGNAVSSGAPEPSVVSVTSDTAEISGTRGARTGPELRDHVKVARDLANEMRDAVWFLSEHGRPRVQLGELLDEAVEAWLARTKTETNGGEPFPKRGRLR